MNKTIDIGGRLVGRDHRPFVIAEMSGNHNQSLDRALEIVEAAAASGAHALKIQTYMPDTMTLGDTATGYRFVCGAWSANSIDRAVSRKQYHR
ncbi:hypothetical protein [Cognatazoarcus halotolerans]|uniref:hypothetical protein n=1 Tax=Cognatazoarcus halotolerans TaxID=2686016 RepID=UPI00190FB5DB|nr:hypothetical protein [Cognatazoarcus halotolerans]